MSSTAAALSDIRELPRITQQGQFLDIDERYVSQVFDVCSARIEPVKHSNGSVELVRRSESLLCLKDGGRFPNAGLLQVLEGLHLAADRPWDDTWYDRDETNIGPPTGASPHLPPGLESFLRRNARGLLKIGPKVDEALLIAAIAHGWPDMGLIVVASKMGPLLKVRQKWAKHSPSGSLGSDRMHFCTWQQARQADFPHDVHLVIVLDAAEVAHADAQSVLWDTGPGVRLIGLLRNDRKLAPSVRDAVSAAFGPASVLDLPTPTAQAARVQTAQISINPPPLDSDLRGIDLYKHGVWFHPERNRRIARLAAALANGDAAVIGRNQQINEWWHETGCRPISTVVFAANLPHALALLERMPDARLSTSIADEDLIDLTPHQQRVVHDRRADFASQLIVTDGTRGWSPEHTDCVIWAAGGPMVREGWHFLTHTEERRRVLFVDCYDRHHHLLRKWSERRFRDCMERGWYPLGMSELEGLVRWFLEGRPENRTGTQPGRRTR